MKRRTAPRRFFPPCSRLLCMIAAPVFIATRFSSALPVISEISVIGGSRGIAVAFSADAPFAAEFSGGGKTVTARFRGCVYGLPEFLYRDFSPSLPLRSISAVEKANSTVELTFTLKYDVGLPVKALRKNAQWIALLSEEPVQPFTWNTAQSTPQAAPATPAVAEPVKQGRLQNIRLLHRGRIGELAFEFDTEVSCSLRRKGATLTVAVENAANSMGNRRLELPGNSAFKRISLREYILDGASMLDISVAIDTTRIESNFNIAFTKGAALSLFVMSRDNRKATLWTSGHGLSWDYKFYDVPSYNVDFQSMGNRARRDAAQKLNRNKTFAIKKPPSEPQVAAIPPSAPVVEVPTPANDMREQPKKDAPVGTPMVVTAKNVNLRSTPSRSAKISGKLTRGETVTVIGGGGAWKKVEAEGITGYVYATLLGNSVPGNDSAGLRNAPVPTTDTPPQTIEPSSSITTVSTTVGAPEKVASPAVQTVRAAELNGNENIETRADTSGITLKRVIRYGGSGRRDPFEPIVPSSVSLSGLPFIENLTLVGVLFDDDDRIALCEDVKNSNQPFSFREHDPVEKGKVLKIYRDKVVFLITEYGISRSFTLELAQSSLEKEAGKK